MEEYPDEDDYQDWSEDGSEAGGSGSEEAAAQVRGQLGRAWLACYTLPCCPAAVLLLPVCVATPAQQGVAAPDVPVHVNRMHAFLTPSAVQPPPPELEQLKAQVQAAIDELGGRVVPKLSWSCPKVGVVGDGVERTVQSARYTCSQASCPKLSWSWPPWVMGCACLCVLGLRWRHTSVPVHISTGLQ